MTFDIKLQWNPGNSNSDGNEKQFELAGFRVIALNFREILFKGEECVNQCVNLFNDDLVKRPCKVDAFVNKKRLRWDHKNYICPKTLFKFPRANGSKRQKVPHFKCPPSTPKNSRALDCNLQ